MEESERSATFDQVEAVPVFPVETRPKSIRPSDGGGSFTRAHTCFTKIWYGRSNLIFVALVIVKRVY